MMPTNQKNPTIIRWQPAKLTKKTTVKCTAISKNNDHNRVIISTSTKRVDEMLSFITGDFLNSPKSVIRKTIWLIITTMLGAERTLKYCYSRRFTSRYGAIAKVPDRSIVAVVGKCTNTRPIIIYLKYNNPVVYRQTT